MTVESYQYPRIANPDTTEFDAMVDELLALGDETAGAEAPLDLDVTVVDYATAKEAAVSDEAAAAALASAAFEGQRQVTGSVIDALLEVEQNGLPVAYAVAQPNLVSLPWAPLPAAEAIPHRLPW